MSTSDVRLRVDVPEDIEARELAISPDGKFAAVSTVSRSQWTVGSTGFAVFDLDRGRLVATLDGHKPYTCNAAFVSSGRFLATASSDRTVRLWEVGTWREVDRIDIPSHADEPVAVTAWDAHDAFVLTGERGLAYVFAVDASPRRTIRRNAS
jgi:WD40 repeat protein